jgi:hypothetical protein
MKTYLQTHFDRPDELRKKIILYHLKNKLLQKVIHKHADFTELGQDISNEIDYVIALSDRLLIKMQITDTELLEAKQQVTEHFKSVNMKYKNLCY